MTDFDARLPSSYEGGKVPDPNLRKIFHKYELKEALVRELVNKGFTSIGKMAAFGADETIVEHKLRGRPGGAGVAPITPILNENVWVSGSEKETEIVSVTAVYVECRTKHRKLAALETVAEVNSALTGSAGSHEPGDDTGFSHWHLNDRPARDHAPEVAIEESDHEGPERRGRQEGPTQEKKISKGARSRLAKQAWIKKSQVQIDLLQKKLNDRKFDENASFVRPSQRERSRSRQKKNSSPPPWSRRRGKRFVAFCADVVASDERHRQEKDDLAKQRMVRPDLSNVAPGSRPAGERPGERPGEGKSPPRGRDKSWRGRAGIAHLPPNELSKLRDMCQIDQEGNKICLAYNSSAECDILNCKFRHICMKCNSQGYLWYHGAVQHHQL